jgi:hypothetical protein
MTNGGSLKTGAKNLQLPEPNLSKDFVIRVSGNITFENKG